VNGLVALGLVIGVVGLLVAGVGFVRTFRRFAGPGEELWSPATSRARQLAGAAAGRIDRSIRRLLRRPRNQTIVVGSAALSLGGALSARVLVSYGQLQRLWNHKGALLQLHERTNELRRLIEDARFESREEGKRLQDDITELQSRIDTDRGLVRKAHGEEAKSDSRLQFWGFVGVLLGLVLQIAGTVS